MVCIKDDFHLNQLCQLCRLNDQIEGQIESVIIGWSPWAIDRVSLQLNARNDPGWPTGHRRGAIHSP